MSIVTANQKLACAAAGILVIFMSKNAAANQVQNGTCVNPIFASLTDSYNETEGLWGIMTVSGNYELGQFVNPVTYFGVTEYGWENNWASTYNSNGPPYGTCPWTWDFANSTIGVTFTYYKSCGTETYSMTNPWTYGWWAMGPSGSGCNNYLNLMANMSAPPYGYSYAIQVLSNSNVACSSFSQTVSVNTVGAAGTYPPTGAPQDLLAYVEYEQGYPLDSYGYPEQPTTDIDLCYAQGFGTTASYSGSLCANADIGSSNTSWAVGPSCQDVTIAVYCDLLECPDGG